MVRKFIKEGKEIFECGFVNPETEGKFRYYSLNLKTIGPMMEIIEAHMSKYCIHILRNMKGGSN